MKRKVLIIATSSKTRGGISAVINIYKKNKLWENWNCLWVETHIDKSIFYKSLFFFRAIFCFLFHIGSASLVHVHLSGPVSVKRKMIFVKLSRLFGKPVIIHFHSFSATSRIDINYANLYGKVFSLANKIVVLSQSWKDGLINALNIAPGKIEVIYNPCPSIELPEGRKQDKTILYAGTLNERKNFKTLIKAFALIADKIPEWKLVLAGNGDIEKGKKLAQELKIIEQVIFKGWVDGNQKHALFLKSSIFCLPSYAEGFPMAILDAWAYRLPVITTPVGGIPDIAIDGENMILFDPDDSLDLSNKLLLLLKDANYRKQLELASLEFSKSEFSAEFICIQLEELYANTVLDNK